MPWFKDKDEFLITRPGDLTGLQRYFEGRDFAVYVTPVGNGRSIKFEIMQVTPKIRGNRRVAAIGDTVRYDGGLVVVDHPVKAPAAHAGAAWSADALFPSGPGAVA